MSRHKFVPSSTDHTICTYCGMEIKDNVHVNPPCFGQFDEEYTMDSECPKCSVIELCKEETNAKV